MNHNVLTAEEERQLIAAHRHGAAVAKAHDPMFTENVAEFAATSYATGREDERYSFAAGYVATMRRLKAAREAS